MVCISGSLFGRSLVSIWSTSRKCQRCRQVSIKYKGMISATMKSLYTWIYLPACFFHFSFRHLISLFLDVIEKYWVPSSSASVYLRRAWLSLHGYVRCRSCIRSLCFPLPMWFISMLSNRLEATITDDSWDSWSCLFVWMLLPILWM